MSSCLKTHVLILIALTLGCSALSAEDKNSSPEDKPPLSPAEAQARRIEQERAVEQEAEKTPGITELKKKSAEPIEITADGENRFEGGMAYASGNVVVHYKDSIVYADSIAYDSKSKTLIATGNVRIYSGTQVFRADQATYSFEEKKIISSTFWTTEERIFVKGASVNTDLENGLTKYTIKNGSFTSDNREKPAFHADAHTIEIYPGDRVIVKNTVLYLGSVPVFWVPYFYYSLKDNQSTVDIQPGSSGQWGTYFLTATRWQVNPRLTASFDYDFRSKRGSGGGIDLTYKPKNGSMPTLFKSFITHDDDPDIDLGTPDRPIAPKPTRYRFSYQQNYFLADDLNAIADVNIYSDRHVTEDYFPGEYDDNRKPDDVVAVSKYDPNFTLTALGRGQMNNLYQVAERKPEVALEVKRQNIPGTPLSYEGESSMANLQMRYDRDTSPQPSDYHAVRYDTYHEILYPRQYFGWLSVTPLAGARATSWSHNNGLSDSDPADQIARLAFNVGLESSFKASRTWLDVQDKDWGIDGLRHVVEPYVNIAYMPRPNVTSQDIQGFDTRLPNTKLQPINFPDYNSIDSIDGMEIVRHGVIQKLQTKRDGENVDLVTLATYGDLNLDREAPALTDQPYSQLYNDVGIYPLPWLHFNIDSSAGLTKGSFDEVNTMMTYQPFAALETSIYHRYLSDFPLYFQGTNQRVFDNSSVAGITTFYRLNENWRVSQNLAFDVDNGDMEDQSYSIYRDLTALDISLTGGRRSNIAVPNEYYFYLTFTLKAFPEAQLRTQY